MSHRDGLLSIPLSITAHVVCLLGIVYLLHGDAVLPALFVDLASDPEIEVPVVPFRAESGSPGRRVPTAGAAPKARSSRGPSLKVEPTPTLASSGKGGPASAESHERSVVTRSEPPGSAEDRKEPISVPAPPMSFGEDRASTEMPPAPPPGSSTPWAGGGTDHGPGGSIPTTSGVPGGSTGNTRGGEGGGGALPNAGGGRASTLAARGDGGTTGSEYGPYLVLWRTRIRESVPYPMAARRRSLTGTVQIEIVIGPNGAVREVKLVESSSHGVLDTAVLESVRQLPPLPFPPHLAPRTIRARLPVVFEMR